MLSTNLSCLILYFYLFYQYLVNTYPEKIQSIIINVTCSCVYLYSKCQIGLSKMTNIVSFYMIKYIPNIFENNQNELMVTFILNNDPIITMSKTELLYILENKTNENVLDYCNNDDNDDNDDVVDDFTPLNNLIRSVYEFLSKLLVTHWYGTPLQSSNSNLHWYKLLDVCDLILIHDNKNNIKIMKKSELILENFTSNESDVLQIKPVQYKPLLCELLIDDDDIKIDFKDKNGGYNYLILNNSFDCKFISYFMKQHYNILNLEGYILRVLDDTVNTILFDKTNLLHIGENKLKKI